MTTKELIYKNALELFSKNGYNNVGMRDLAKSVGIKAASIYNHYKGKEEILLSIADSLVEKMRKEIYPLYKRDDLSPREFFTNISLSTNTFFEKEEINQLTRLLIPEQFNSNALKNILHDEFIIKPRTALTYYFKNLMDKGLMKKENPLLAAKLYHSFFIYHFYEKYLTDNPEGFMLTYEELFKEHITLFMNYFNIK
ncbi:Transcriptional regulator, TetR family [Alteracholeplasma palmae J233]|uniref:Transcriptional regulator, TetR family n=1 Tax=Alteracholeplasma palmae (strain ATCC 49389 / J233) TaxID=1318466 RepID=U4KR20_ALTPJ|nr:TetR/AcrR family transcriptional regulator [Alteracholeplasma palmae]CCV63791.1 Transcriptional regulator, TetR family [Alteracholeplasma palmae J233]